MQDLQGFYLLTFIQKYAIVYIESSESTHNIILEREKGITMRYHSMYHRRLNPEMYPLKWGTPSNWISAIALAVVLFLSMIPF